MNGNVGSPRRFPPIGAPVTVAAGWVARAARAIGRLAATGWRLARALDTALWRGVLFMLRALASGLQKVIEVAVATGADFVAWLPSRAGRAYTAFSGIVLTLSGLWIVDELNAPLQSTLSAQNRLAPPVDLDDPILARLDGRYVHLSEVAAFALATGAIQEKEQLTAKDAFARDLVEAYVDQRLLARAATDSGVHRQPQTARQLALARERILASVYMQSRLEAVVSDAAVRRLFTAHGDVASLGDEVRARHIVVATEEEAAVVIAALDAGEDFAAVAARLSLDRSAPFGGELGFFTRANMAPAIAAAAFSTPPGTRAAPFQSDKGWHVLEVQERRRSASVSFDAVKDGIRQFLTNRTIEDTLKSLKAESDVVFFSADDDADAFDPAAASTSEG